MEYQRLARLTALPVTDPLFDRLVVRMATVRALRWRPALFRQGAARE
jgi:hypothetical protein